jgi:hypothetical protein
MPYLQPLDYSRLPDEVEIPGTTVGAALDTFADAIAWLVNNQRWMDVCQTLQANDLIACMKHCQWVMAQRLADTPHR